MLSLYQESVTGEQYKNLKSNQKAIIFLISKSLEITFQV